MDHTSDNQSKPGEGWMQTNALKNELLSWGQTKRLRYVSARHFFVEDCKGESTA